MRRFFSNHKKLFFGLLFAALFSTTVALATPPTGGYAPGATLDPDCAPNSSADCIVRILPDQTGNTGKFLTTDGTTTSWGTIPGGNPGTVTAFSFTNANGFTGTVLNGSSIPALSLSLQNATASQSGQLTASDWNAFNSKQAAITTGTTAQYLRGDLSLATFPTTVSAFTNDANYITGSRQIISGTGISGGGNLSADRTISLDINSLTTKTSALMADTIPVYDSATSSIKKISRSDFLQGLTGAITYQGSYNANTNTPNLTDGTGSAGQEYVVTVAGTRNFGSGAITLGVGDFIIHNGSIWQVAPSSSAVSSVFGRTGTVTAQSGDYNTSQVTENASFLYFTNARAQTALAGLYEVPLTFSTGLTRSTNTITNNLSTGVSGGQSVIGGTASGNSLTLSSTTNATKGKILFGTSGYDEANNRLGLGATTPSTTLQVSGDTQLGGASNYLAVSSSGTLTFAGTGDFRVANNAYAFRSAVYPGAGIFFNSTTKGVEVRDYVGGVAQTLISADPTSAGTSYINANGGMLGIGTSSPGAKVDITDSVSGVSTASSLRITTTWNTSGSPTALLVNIGTNTQSGASAKLLDLQVAGVSKFAVSPTAITAASLAGTGTRMVVADASGVLATQAVPAGTVTNVTATLPISSSGGTTPNISISQASTSGNGYLSSTDWNIFNGKQAALSGTGFVKSTGGTISYDTSTYLTTAAAGSTYVPYTGATANVNLGSHSITTIGIQADNFVSTGLTSFSSTFGANFDFDPNNDGYDWKVRAASGTFTPLWIDDYSMGNNGFGNGSRVRLADGALDIWSNGKFGINSNAGAYGNTLSVDQGNNATWNTIANRINTDSFKVYASNNGPDDIYFLNQNNSNELYLFSDGSSGMTATNGGDLSLYNSNNGNSMTLYGDGHIESHAQGGGDYLISNDYSGNNILLSGNGAISIASAGSQSIMLDVTSGDAVRINSGNNTPFVISTVGGNTCTFTTTGVGAGLFSCASDARLKHDILPLADSSLAKILSLNPVTYHYNWQQDTEAPIPGFVAQEFETVFPEMVTTDPATGYKSLSYVPLIPYTIKAIQEMNIRMGAIPAYEDRGGYEKIRDFLQGVVDRSEIFIDHIRAKKIESDEVQTKTLCIDNLCITKDQLQQILQNQSQNASPSQNIPAPASVQMPQPDAVPVESSQEAVQPESSPQ